MTHSLRFAVSLLALGLGLGACKRQDEPGLSKEPLARATPVTAPASTAVAAPGKPSETVAAPSESKPKREAPSAERGDDSEPYVTPPKSSKREAVKTESPSSTSEAQGIKLKRLVVTRAIEHREPVETSHFSAGSEPVFAFVELGSALDEPSEISISFEREGGKSVGHVKLTVPSQSSRWRTWGKTKLIRTPGTWTAIVRGADGSELGRKSFEVE